MYRISLVSSFSYSRSVRVVDCSARHYLGTYFIDPDLPVSDGNALKKGRPSKKRSRQANPNASFRTRRGTININLAILGSPTGVSKAMVELTTHRSDIAVNLVTSFSVFIV